MRFGDAVFHPPIAIRIRTLATSTRVQRGSHTPGRSSDFPSSSAAFPPGRTGQWLQTAENVPLRQDTAGDGVTAAGPFPIFTGFPFKRNCTRLKGDPMESFDPCQEEKMRVALDSSPQCVYKDPDIGSSIDMACGCKTTFCLAPFFRYILGRGEVSYAPV
jgi:hypothetical protein